MYFTRRLMSYSKWNGQASEWLNSKWGRRARIGLLCGTIISYPIGSMLINGPLVKWTFPKRHSCEPLTDKLKGITDKEYARFLEKESRIPKDAVSYSHLGSGNELDSVAAGSLGVRSGLHTALPFYARFNSVDDAVAYFKTHAREGLDILGERLSIDWDSPVGRELAATFVLSEQAIRFVALRDLYAHDGYAALAQRSISWTTWTSFTSIFTYWLHKSAKVFGGTAASFLGIYAAFVGMAWFCNNQWHALYRYVTDVHADSVSAHTSFGHCEGGKEFYWKMLKRNRILRDLHPNMKLLIAPSGNVRDSYQTSIIMRYDHLKDLKEEDDELLQVVNMDA